MAINDKIKQINQYFISVFWKTLIFYIIIILILSVYSTVISEINKVFLVQYLFNLFLLNILDKIVFFMFFYVFVAFSLYFEDSLIIRFADKRFNFIEIINDIILLIERYFYFYKNGTTYYKRMEKRKEFIVYIENVLVKYNLQKEYSYIPFVESGYNMNSYNKYSGAKGMYQFLKSTAIEYGLKVNKNIDQREDFILSTESFAKYIRSMASIFGYESFLIICASYNSGDGTIRKALKKIENVKEDRSFFYLYKKNLIPNETRDYVCKIVGAIVLTKYLNY